MHAQILTGDEIGNLTGRITDAVVAVLADLASNVDEPALHGAAQALVVATRDQLARKPVDAAPMVRAILRRNAAGRPLAAHEQDEFGVALSQAIPVTPVAPLPVELDWEFDVDTRRSTSSTATVTTVTDATDATGATGEVATGEVATGEVATGEVATVEGAPVEGAPVKRAPVKRTPVKAARVKGEPVKRPLVKRAPVKDAPAEDAPADGASVEAPAAQLAAAVEAGAAQAAPADPPNPVVTPSYWPPAPVVSDKLFAQFTADNGNVVPQRKQKDAGQDHAEDASEAPSAGPGTDQATAEAPAPESDPSQPGHFYAGPLARWNRYHPAVKAGEGAATPGRTEP